MATSSRDRLIHVFKAGPEYSFLQTLDDHSASIPAIKFNSMFSVFLYFTFCMQVFLIFHNISYISHFVWKYLRKHIYIVFKYYQWLSLAQFLL